MRIAITSLVLTSLAIGYLLNVACAVREQERLDSELINAVQRGDVNKARTLMDRGASPNSAVDCYVIYQAPNIWNRIKWTVVGREPDFRIPLLKYARGNQAPEMVHLLKRAGARE